MFAQPDSLTARMADFFRFVLGKIRPIVQSSKGHESMSDIVADAPDPPRAKVPLTKTRSASMSGPRTLSKGHHATGTMTTKAGSKRSDRGNSNCDLDIKTFAPFPSETKKPQPKPEPVQCAICLDECTNPKKLDRCGHIFCTDCIDRYFNTVKPQCPCCFVVYGEMRGNQPDDGRMDTHRTHHRLPGFEKNSTGTIEVHYRFRSGIQDDRHPNPGMPYYGTARKAYLPDNDEGRHVLQLLERAFHLRQTFTIGQSRTTGQENVVTWNDIHHKTSYSGGTENFGYPDPNYLKRVQQELAAKGIQ